MIIIYVRIVQLALKKKLGVSGGAPAPPSPPDRVFLFVSYHFSLYMYGTPYRAEHDRVQTGQDKTEQRTRHYRTERAGQGTRQGTRQEYILLCDIFDYAKYDTIQCMLRQHSLYQSLSGA